MSKRRSHNEAGAGPSKQRRNDEEHITLIVCGLYFEGKTAVARGLLKELKSATVIVSDLKAGQQAFPKAKAGAFEVIEYTKETPQLPTTQGLNQNVVVISHDLAQPSRVRVAMASDNRTARLLTVIDARTFLDDWESPMELPSAIREAGKKDVRAHLHDKKACEVLAECVESADVIALSHAEAADTDELEMLEAMLRELNPSATIVRRDGDGEGGGKLREHVVQASSGGLAERSGCWQILLEARSQDDSEEGAVDAAGEKDGREEEEGEEGEEWDVVHDEDDEDEDEDEDGREGEECEDEEGEEHGDSEEGDEANEDWIAPAMSRFTFLARRPFHPARLHKLLKHGRLDGVIRSCGIVWIATHPKDSVMWNQVGNSMNLLPGQPWLTAKLPVAQWPPDAPHWARTASHGDRRIELGLIGMDADPVAVRRVLSRALVTKAEFEEGVWGRYERIGGGPTYWWLLGAHAMASAAGEPRQGELRPSLGHTM